MTQLNSSMSAGAAPSPPAVPSLPSMPNTAPRCVKCANSGVFPVSIYVNAADAALRKKLAPPEEPQRRFTVALGGLICNAAFAGLGLLMALYSLITGQNDGLGALGIAGFFCLMAALCAIPVWDAQRYNKQKWPGLHAHWQQKMLVWQTLIYCPNCDAVSDLSRKTSVPAAAYKSLL